MKNVHELLIELLKSALRPDFKAGVICLDLNDDYSLELYIPEYAARPFSPGNVRRHKEHRTYRVLTGEVTEMVYIPMSPSEVPNFVVHRGLPGAGEYVQPLLTQYRVHQANNPSTETFEVLANDFHQTLAPNVSLLLVQKTTEAFAMEETMQKYPWLHQDWLAISPELMRHQLHSQLVRLTLDQCLLIEEALK